MSIIHYCEFKRVCVFCTSQLKSVVRVFFGEKLEQYKRSFFHLNGYNVLTTVLHFF